MPIYEYRCDACGHQLEVIQKLNDAPLTACPACDKSALRKMVSAGGFQLKGSGWYATDFKRPARDKETSGAGEGKEKAGGDTPKSGCGGGSCGCH